MIAVPAGPKTSGIEWLQLTESTGKLQPLLTITVLVHVVPSALPAKKGVFCGACKSLVRNAYTGPAAPS
jgi:hypothetical protein